jgi:hypothetical protein
MVQVFKEQKIAYPRGYSSNWRELIPKKQIPIVEGDEVEFDTKKGRKKGVAELVVDKDGDLIIDYFLNHIIQGYFVKDGEEIGVKELKLKTLPQIKKKDEEMHSKENRGLKYSDLTKEEQKEITTWFKWLYQNDTTGTILKEDGDVVLYYTPVSLDVDELEDLNIVDKNITKVAKKSEDGEKVVKPTKYPDPFVYSNKDLANNLKDIAEYLGTMILPKYIAFREQNDGTTNAIMSTTEANGLLKNLSLPVEEQIVFFDKYFSDIIHILCNDYDNLSSVGYALKNLVANQSYPKTWVDLEAKSSNDSHGLFQNYGVQFYDFNMPRVLAEFRVTAQKQFEPMGITSRQDIVNLIEEQKTKINGFELEKTQLDDTQVFEELVQEVIRTQQALNSEEIRAGSSYMARAELFGKENSDYIGNKMLSIFQNTDEETLKTIDSKFRPSDRAIAEARERRMATSSMNKEEVETKVKGKRGRKPTTKGVAPIVEVVDVAVDEKLATENLINDLREAMEFEDDAEQVKTQQLIDDLVEALEFM